MLSKDRLGQPKRVYFRPEFHHCSHCEHKLKRRHTAWNKKIVTLDGVIHAWSMAYVCPNPACPQPGAFYKSAEAEMLSMKHSSYGYDVLCLVGEMRFQRHMTVSEIQAALNERGIQICERYSQELYERFQLLLATTLDTQVKRVLNETVAVHGGIVLSMDGVQPEKGNETLYVLREVFSGTVLAAKNMKSGTAAELQRLMKPIIDLGHPIVGIVSDGQQSIRRAFETLLPDVPYQYCQYHYLKDIAKPVVDADRKLKTELKKSMRGIRDIERKIENAEAKLTTADTGADAPSVEAPTAAARQEVQIAKKYVATVRALLLEDGDPPLNLPGMIIFERAQAIQASLERCLSKKGALLT